MQKKKINSISGNISTEFQAFTRTAQHLIPAPSRVEGQMGLHHLGSQGTPGYQNPVVQGKLLLAYAGLAPSKTSAKAQQEEEEGEGPLWLLQNLSKEDTPGPVSSSPPTSTRCTRAPSSVQPRHRSAASSHLCFCRLKNKPETNNTCPPRHRFPLAQKKPVLPSANFYATIPTIILAANLIGGKKRAPEV